MFIAWDFFEVVHRIVQEIPFIEGMLVLLNSFF